MAAQYVEKLSLAEKELQAVRDVWAQAEDDLAALRSSPRGSNDNSSRGATPHASPRGSLAGAHGAAGAAVEQPGSPRLLAANGRVGRQDFELVRSGPSNAPAQVAGRSHARAETEHGMQETLALVVELPSPRFGGGHVGNFPEGFPAPAGSSSSSKDPAVSAKDAFAGGSAGSIYSRSGNDRPVESSSNSSSSAPATRWGLPVVAAASVGPQVDAQYAALQHAAEQGVRSSSSKARVHVRVVPEGPAVSDSSFSSAYSSGDELGSLASCSTDME
jgi:hypothetical protein